MPISLIILDIDGVFTSGYLLVDKNGNEFKTISFRDIDAYFRLKRKGYLIGFITGEDTPFVEYFQKRFSPDFLIRGCKDKLTALKSIAENYNTTLGKVVYCGDSRSDIQALKACGFSFAPQNAEKPVMEVVDFVIPRNGGEGILELLEEEIEKFENSRK